MESQIDWILVVNTPSCKSCLDNFYKELNILCPSRGKIVVVTNKIKEFENSLLASFSCLDIVFDIERLTLKENIIGYPDELVLISESNILKASVRDYSDFMDYIAVH